MGTSDGAAENFFWLPHGESVFLPGRFRYTEASRDVFETEAGGDVSLPAGTVAERVVDKCALNGVDDVTLLDAVGEAEVLHTVRVRYSRDEIYTGISRMLIAVNPFKSLDIYSAEHIELYG